jgi:hypothetical protein
MSRSFRRWVLTSARVASARIWSPSSVSATSLNGGVDEPEARINCTRKRTSMVLAGADVDRWAASAWKTPGPVERLEHPEPPGRHHQIPCGSAGLTATQKPPEPMPMSIGLTVTMYGETECCGLGVDRHASSTKPASKDRHAHSIGAGTRDMTWPAPARLRILSWGSHNRTSSPPYSPAA